LPEISLVGKIVTLQSMKAPRISPNGAYRKTRRIKKVNIKVFASAFKEIISEERKTILSC
jgi:hypothetical protein